MDLVGPSLEPLQAWHIPRQSRVQSMLKRVWPPLIAKTKLAGMCLQDLQIGLHSCTSLTPNQNWTDLIRKFKLIVK
jgi:hypothetical protein